MASKRVEDVLHYLSGSYPKFNGLSDATMAEILYLIDWKSVLNKNSQLTNGTWFYNQRGPYLERRAGVVQHGGDFQRPPVPLHGRLWLKLGHLKQSATRMLAALSAEPGLDACDKSTIDFVLRLRERKTEDEFSLLVDSTYPVMTHQEDRPLDMVSAAQAYQKVRAQMEHGNGASLH